MPGLPLWQGSKNNPAMSIGRVIRALRLERGLTQEELALEADVATSNVSRIESGQRQPTGDLLRRLARALGTSVSRIHGLAEEVDGDLLDGFEPLVDGCRMDPPHLGLVQQLATDAPDNDTTLLLRYFRELNAENRQLVMAQVKLLRQLQRQREGASDADTP